MRAVTFRAHDLKLGLHPGKAIKSRLNFENMQAMHPMISHLPSRQSTKQTHARALPDNCSKPTFPWLALVHSFAEKKKEV